MKSLGPDGEIGDRGTTGLLRRRAVVASSIRHIGKEANHLEEVESGLIGDIGEVLNDYPDPRRDPLRTLVLPVLVDLSDREVGRRIGVDHKTIAGIRRGANPHRSTKEKLVGLAWEVANNQLANPSPQVLALLVEGKGI